MTIRRSQVALNPIQWTNLPPDPAVPGSEGRWRYGEPSFVADYPGVLAELAASGFDATMMEVLDTQTLVRAMQYHIHSAFFTSVLVDRSPSSCSSVAPFFFPSPFPSSFVLLPFNPNDPF